MRGATCMPLQPRCTNCGPDAITGWIEDIAKFLKSVDPNHMVTTGEEGQSCCLKGGAVGQSRTAQVVMVLI